MSDELLAPGSEVRLGPPTLVPHRPVLAALRHAVGGGTAVVVGLAEGDGPARDVLGLLPPVAGDDDGPGPQEVARLLADHVPAGTDLAVAAFAVPMAVAALRVVPPVGGAPVEALLADAATSARDAARMWRRLGEHRVWVPVADLGGAPSTSALGGALEVAELPEGVDVPELPLLDRDGHAAVHVFSGAWQLVHADPPFPAAVRTTVERVAAAMPPAAALAIDVGCLHATLLTPPRR